MEFLDNWKTNNCHENSINRKLFLVAADVQALYQSVRRDLVDAGVRKALTTCTNYKPVVIDTLVQLTMFSLKNIIVRNGDTFYNQIDGLVTGDNHSVSIANITLHYITLPIADLINKTVVYKRYIDDIMWISESEEYTQ